MKKTLRGAAVATLLVATLFAAFGPAHAADMQRGYQTYAPPPPQIFRWTGPYLGANIGYQGGSMSNNPTEPSGIAGGIQAGWNWQNGNFVFGGEADINLSNAEDVFAPWKFSNPWFGTVRGRLGLAYSNMLFYGTGGLAFGGFEAETFGLSETKTHLGWTVGAGVEFALTPAWSAKVEYLYLSYADRAYSLTGTDNGFDSNVVRFGVNYRF